MNYKVITAGATALDFSDVQDHLRVDASPDDQTYIEALLDEAQGLVELHSNKSLLETTWEVTLDRWPVGSIIYLSKGPVSSIDSVKYDDSDGTEQTMVENTDYNIDISGDPARIYLIEKPDLEDDAIGRIRVRFKAGYADKSSIPKPLVRAFKLFVAYAYEMREDQPMTAGEIGKLATKAESLCQMFNEDWI